MSVDPETYNYEPLREAVAVVLDGDKRNMSVDLSDTVHTGIEMEDEVTLAVNIQVEDPVDEAVTAERIRDVGTYESLAGRVENHVTAVVGVESSRVSFYRQPTPFTSSVTFRGLLHLSGQEKKTTAESH